MLRGQHRQASQQQASDPVAAAIRAKQERIREALKAAARLAEKNGPVTLLFEPKEQANDQPKEGGHKGEATSSSKEQTSMSTETVEASDGPSLRDLLGYDADEDVSPSQTPGHTSNGQQAVPAEQPQEDGGKPSADAMDRELALFMEELESDGLLKEVTELEEARAAAAAAAAATPPAATQPQAQPPQPLQIPAAAPGAAGAAPGPGHQQGQQGGGETPGGPAEAGALSSAAAEGDQADDDQKLLGYLKWDPAWSKVLDTTSGQVYFWNLSTNQVVWDPPPGCDPDDLIPPDGAPSTGPAEGLAAGAGAQGGKPEHAATSGGAAGAGVQEAEPGQGAVSAGGVVGPTSDPAQPASELASTAGVKKEQEQGGSDGMEDGELPDTGPADAIGASTTSSGSQQQGGAPAPETRPSTSAGSLGASAGPGMETPAGTSTGAAAGTAGSSGAAMPGLFTLPDPLLTSRLEALALRARGAARYFMTAMPAIMRVALHAEALEQEWAALSKQQAAAAGSKQASKALTWGVYQQHVQQRLRTLQAQLPDAIAEAEKLQAQGGQQPEVKQEQPAASAAAKSEGEVAPSAKIAAAGGLQSKPSTATPSAYGGVLHPPAASTSALHGADASHSSYSWYDHHAYHLAAAAASGYPAMYGTPADYAAYWGQHGVAPDGSAWQYTGVGGGGIQGRSSTTTTWGTAGAAIPPAPSDDSAPPPPPSSPPPLPPDEDGPAVAAGASTGSGQGASIQHGQSGGEQLPPPPLPPLPGSTGSLQQGSDEVEDVDMQVDDDHESSPPPPLPGTSTGSGQVPVAAAAAPPPRNGQSTRSGPGYAAASVNGAGAAVAAPASTRNKTEYRASPVPAAAALAALTEGSKKRTAGSSDGGGSGSSSKASKKSKSSSSSSGLAPGAKKVGALMSQWVSVKQSLAKEEEEEAAREAEAADPEAAERRRHKEAERWARKQMGAEAATDNANFAPVQGDWRQTLAKVTGKSKSSSSGSSRSSKTSSRSGGAGGGSSGGGGGSAGGYPTRSETRPDLVTLSLGLPIGWQATWDEKTKDIYYTNPSTKEVSWSRP